MNAEIKTIEEKNGVIAAIFLFQYSLLIPLMRYIRPSILVAASGLLLMLCSFVINRRLIIRKRVTLVVALIAAAIAIKSVIDGSEIQVAINFLMIAVPPSIVFSYSFESSSFLRSCQKLSIINFLLLNLLLLIWKKIPYMRYGYGMVLTVLFSYIALFRKDDAQRTASAFRSKRLSKLLSIVVFIASLLEAIIYGSRGVILVIIVFVAIDVLLIYKKNRIRNYFLVGLGFAAFFNLENILELLIQLAGAFGIRSYALRKFQYQLTVGIEEASSGRNHLYEKAIESIKETPLFGSKMITYSDGTLYVHNLFLQIGRDLGVLAMLFSIILVVYCIYLLWSKKLPISHKTVIAILFCVSVVRLMISSIVWERPEFWALLCVTLDHNRILKARDNVFTG